MNMQTSPTLDAKPAQATAFPKAKIAALIFAAAVVLMLVVPAVVSVCYTLMALIFDFGDFSFSIIIYRLFDVLGCLAPVIPTVAPLALIAFGFFAKRKDVACAGAAVFAAVNVFDCIATTGNAFYYYVNAFAVFESFWLAVMALCLFGALLFTKKPMVAKIFSAAVVLSALIMLLCNGISQIDYWFFQPAGYYIAGVVGDVLYALFGYGAYELPLFELCLELIEEMFSGDFLECAGPLLMLLMDQLMYPVTALLLAAGGIATAASVFFMRKAPEAEEPAPVEDEESPVAEEAAPVEAEVPAEGASDATAAEPDVFADYVPFEGREASAENEYRPAPAAPAPAPVRPVTPTAPVRPAAPFGAPTEEIAPAPAEEFKPATRDENRPSTPEEIYGQDMADLKRYQDLLDAGIISQEEFDTKKKEILGL